MSPLTALIFLLIYYLGVLLNKMYAPNDMSEGGEEYQSDSFSDPGNYHSQELDGLEDHNFSNESLHHTMDDELEDQMLVDDAQKKEYFNNKMTTGVDSNLGEETTKGFLDDYEVDEDLDDKTAENSSDNYGAEEDLDEKMVAEEGMNDYGAEEDLDEKMVAEEGLDNDGAEEDLDENMIAEEGLDEYQVNEDLDERIAEGSSVHELGMDEGLPNRIVAGVEEGLEEHTTVGEDLGQMIGSDEDLAGEKEKELSDHFSLEEAEELNAKLGGDEVVEEEWTDLKRISLRGKKPAGLQFQDEGVDGRMGEASGLDESESSSYPGSDQVDSSEAEEGRNITRNEETVDVGQFYNDYYLKMLDSEQPWEKENFDLRQDMLQKSDVDSIKAFRFKISNNITRQAFEQMRYLFRDDVNIESEWKIIQRMHNLSQIEPVWIDMCISSCIAYTKDFESLTSCPICGHTRLDNHNIPYRRFCYIPLIPRLKAFFQNKSMIKLLLYRFNYKYDPLALSDVFDGDGYRWLLNRQVKVDGQTLPYKYFEGKYDIALAFWQDSHQIFRRKSNGPAATPLLVKNLNLPPEIRTHLEYLIPLGIIPGRPKDFASFIHPFQEELVQLAYGVSAFNAAIQQTFYLRAYNIQNEMDIRAADKVVCNTSVNSFSPCRVCLIKGMRDPHAKGGYYCPLAHIYFDDDGDQLFSGDGQPVVKEWNPNELPYRSHKSFYEIGKQLAQAETKKERKILRFQSGLNNYPVFNRVESQHHGRSTPYEIMHLLGLNIIPHLVEMWMGIYKPLKGVRGDYEIPHHIWREIAQETEDAVKDIPAEFIRKLGNIVQNRSSFTAEGWFFWYIYLMPILLKDRFQDSKYYDHACALKDIIVASIQFTINRADVEVLRSNIINWIQAFELLRSDPSANLTNRLLYAAYFTQIVYRFNAADQLALPGLGKNLDLEDDNDILSRFEDKVEGYPLSILRAPHNSQYIPTSDEYSRIVRYFKEVLETNEALVCKNLPISAIAESWGKVRIGSRGDSIRAATILGKRGSERNNSFVRDVQSIQYECDVRLPMSRKHKGPPQYTREIFYGQLMRILICKIPDTSFWGADLRGRTKIIAIIAPCNTKGKDATQEVVEYTKLTAMIATDLQTISAVIGKVATRGRYGLIDRSEASMKTAFVD
ncbi:hypothetical protein D9757_013823 [Collybiopsis confluens]|uniref:Transposase domain-containing protein n=1 Tax=Collybiopsis confluens TaxID=2823264 RepID=A0A8H5FSI1_9AGAR|nr:hypothetical protein D9757_013823 [Collybiopsis confluens]